MCGWYTPISAYLSGLEFDGSFEGRLTVTNSEEEGDFGEGEPTDTKYSHSLHEWVVGGG